MVDVLQVAGLLEVVQKLRKLHSLVPDLEGLMIIPSNLVALKPCEERMQNDSHSIVKRDSIFALIEPILAFLLLLFK